MHLGITGDFRGGIRRAEVFSPFTDYCRAVFTMIMTRLDDGNPASRRQEQVDRGGVRGVQVHPTRVPTVGSEAQGPRCTGRAEQLRLVHAGVGRGAHCHSSVLQGLPSCGTLTGVCEGTALGILVLCADATCLFMSLPQPQMTPEEMMPGKFVSSSH